MIYIKEWVEENILYVHQLYDTVNNKFCTFQQFKDRYPSITRTNFLVYNGVINAIVGFQQKCGIELNPKYNSVPNTAWKAITEGGKNVKMRLLKSDVLPSAVLKWNTVFTNLNWFNIFKLCCKIQDMKLKWFQTRILHRILPTRKYLYDCKIVDDPVCTFCSQDIQTLQHLLWSCDIVQTFWDDIVVKLNRTCPHWFDMSFSEELVLFGCKQGVETDEGLLHIILMAKFYLYRAFMSNTVPTVQGFLVLLKRNIEDLRFVHFLNNTSTKFYDQWMLYSNIFE